MRFATFHGPDRTPVGVSGDQSDPLALRPFHGIPSRGLVETLKRWPKRFDWESACVSLEPALDGDPAAVATTSAALLQAAQMCGVLRFDQSAFVARLFLERYLLEVLDRMGIASRLVDDNLVEIWNIKEGHTSSVWKITVSVGPHDLVHFALNVARDRAASDELLESALLLEEISSKLRTVAAARVLVKKRLSIPDTQELVQVVAQVWVDEALELAILRNPHSGNQRFHAVERFVTHSSEPGRIRSIVGRELDAQEHAVVAKEIVTAMLEGATFDLRSDLTTMPDFEMNEGDWVFSAGHACLVALSPRELSCTTGEALGISLLRLPCKYGVSDRPGQTALLHAALAAANEFCLQHEFLTLEAWLERAAHVPRDRWKELGVANDLQYQLNWHAERGRRLQPA